MLMKEKKIGLGGFQISVAMDAAKAERIFQSPIYQNVVKPALSRLTSRNGGAALKEAPPDVPAPPDDPDAAALWERVSQIGWYHTIDLGNGVITPGFIDNRQSVDRFGLPKDLKGKRCLDIGTYDGFWAFEMERRGASEVVAIDVDSRLDHDLPRLAKQRLLQEAGSRERLDERLKTERGGAGLQMPGAGFRLAKEVLGSKVERVPLNVYDLSPEKVGTFDVVLISQLLLRLRDPQTVIENMFSVSREMAIVAEPYDTRLESLNIAVSGFLGTDTFGVWWTHSIKSMIKMMQVAGFSPIEEVDRFPVSNRVGSFQKVILKGYVPSGGAAVSAAADDLELPPTEKRALNQDRT